MGYLGKQPSAVPLTTADLIDGSITNADIGDLDAAKLTGTVNNARISLDAAEIPNLDTAKVTTGTFDNARISAGSVTQHVPVTDLTAVHQAIATLALHTAVADNKAAFNLPNAFIDTFEDDTGIATETDTDRDSSGEYVLTSSTVTVSGAYTADANTTLLLHMDDTAFTDSSTATNKGDPTIRGSVTRSSVQAKFGTYSALVAASASNANSLYFADHADWDAGGSTNHTIDYWLYLIALPPSDQTYPVTRFGTSGTHGNYIKADGTISQGIHSVSELNSASSVVPIGSWHHYAIVKNGASDTKIYKDGVQVASGSGNFADGSTALNIGGQNPAITNTPSLNGYIDEVRVSNIARWTTAFTPNANSSTTGTNATGTLVSTVQTAPVATTTLSGVILYTDEAGTNTIGTDLEIYLTANLQGTTPNWTGTNWTEAASYGTAQTFSGTTKQVKLGKTTVTSGTAVALKGVWANQVASTGTAKTITASGHTNHSTTQEKFGDTSIYFDGTGDYLSTPSHSDFNFSGDFTFECWVYWDGTSGEIINFDAGGGGGTRDFRIFFANSKLKFVAQDIGADHYFESSGTVSSNTWTHIAVVRSGDTVTGYNNGTAMNTPISVSGSISGTVAVHIGGVGDVYYTGYMDEIRLSDSARYASAFSGSVPSAIFTSDSNTVLLIHSDTTNGSTAFTDSSPVPGKVARLNGWAVNY